jgi:hypothetical protein
MEPINQTWFSFFLQIQKKVYNIWTSVRRAPIKHGCTSYYKKIPSLTTTYIYIGPHKTVNNYTKTPPRHQSSRWWRRRHCQCLMPLHRRWLQPLWSMLHPHRRSARAQWLCFTGGLRLPSMVINSSASLSVENRGTPASQMALLHLFLVRSHACNY